MTLPKRFFFSKVPKISSTIVNIFCWLFLTLDILDSFILVKSDRISSIFEYLWTIFYISAETITRSRVMRKFENWYTSKSNSFRNIHVRVLFTKVEEMMQKLHRIIWNRVTRFLDKPNWDCLSSECISIDLAENERKIKLTTKFNHSTCASVDFYTWKTFLLIIFFITRWRLFWWTVPIFQDSPSLFLIFKKSWSLTHE